jgi:hypothetical protein
MATDRMWLECICGSPFRLARLDSDIWHTGSGTDLQQRLDAWFEEHANCDPEFYPASPKFSYESAAPTSPALAKYMAAVRAGEVEDGKAFDGGIGIVDNKEA